MTVRADSHPHWRSRETLTAVGYALLFSVPVGVGVTVMMTRVAPGGLTDPLVVGPGLVLAVAVFALVVAAATTGENAA
ncbi:hypothetical protein C454_14465 [Haloferax gibbonsii ATCC 33959]|uniref:Uncharacterized protein n=1 Tax=Haloferax gibbonsii (strain ATCC 33959 / DSM 4427 / JCM 8863 / NBRC 102184 / NCIMB 2188 / Ma 2.38) TaxID=1227459 RepID=M0GZP2_HALGM|nr:hypothetical protein [Haloferax gibbonsii]ELZ77705.1 hypothetical protein C454_14465 [Haloferax gibbonsii ATCC 33959]